MSLSNSRIRELERIERKMQALEAGGVDNWDGYDDSLDCIRREDAIEDLVEKFQENICEVMCEHGEEPAGRDAGYGIRSEGQDEITTILYDFIKEYKLIQED